MRYLICVNMPGYMPEGEPYVVDSSDKAFNALVDEVSRTVGYGILDDGFDTLYQDKNYKALRDSFTSRFEYQGEFGIMVGEYAHTATPYNGEDDD